MRLSLFAAASLCLVVVAVAPASATVVTYNSASSFTAATTGVTTYTFPQTFASAPSQSYSVGPLSFQPGVPGPPASSYYETYNDGIYGSNQSYLELTNTTSQQEVETILLSSSATALGFQIGGDGASYTVAVNGAVVGSFTSPFSNSLPLPSVFFGVTDTDPISSITFTTNAVDTDTLFVRVGQAAAIAPTPEPSSFALLGTGLLGVVSVARKRFAQ